MHTQLQLIPIQNGYQVASLLNFDDDDPLHIKILYSRNRKTYKLQAPSLNVLYQNVNLCFSLKKLTCLKFFEFKERFEKELTEQKEYLKVLLMTYNYHPGDQFFVLDQKFKISNDYYLNITGSTNQFIITENEIKILCAYKKAQKSLAFLTLLNKAIEMIYELVIAHSSLIQFDRNLLIKINNEYMHFSYYESIGLHKFSKLVDLTEEVNNFNFGNYLINLINQKPHQTLK